jgi:hypothetical protein
VSGHDLRVARYWFGANLARRRASYLTIILLIGVVGGIAMGSIGSARRTESSYDTFLKGTNPSDLTVQLFAPNLSSKLARLALVRRVATASYSVNAFPANRDGVSLLPKALLSGDVESAGLMRGEYENMDKLLIVAGHLANPQDKDQFVMTADAEHFLGWHVGQTIRMNFYTNRQVASTTVSSKLKPYESLRMHLVGTVEQNDELVSDVSERYPALMIFTPALTRPFTKQPGYFDYGLQLVHGASDVAKVEREIINALPPGTTYSFHETSIYTGQVNRSIAPEAIALGVFGLIAALAALVIAGSLLARELQQNENDVRTLRALGASPSTIVKTSLFGSMAAVSAGSLLAMIVAVALSPLSPIGPVRAVYPDKGFASDWLVLLVGFGVLVVTLCVLGILVILRQLRTIENGAQRQDFREGSTIARRLAEAGLPITAVVGVRFALGTGRSRDSSPVRFALLGSVFAVLIVVTTLTFGSSLNTLISHPRLFGWNWSYALGSTNNFPPQELKLLTADPYVEAWSGFNLANAQIDGITVPILLTPNHARVSPPLLSGHEVDANNQIVLGAQTLQQLHKRVGQTVVATYGAPKDKPVYVPPTRVLIVGSTTLPAVGGSQTLHTSMGFGAILPNGIEPPAFQKFLHSPIEAFNGPQIVFVRLRSGAPKAQALSSLKKIVASANRTLAAVPNGQGAGVSVDLIGVQYPAEVENYKSIGDIPAGLALGLAAGAVVALGLTLVSSVRRKRRDLALLRTLGFTRRQLMATIAYQASVAGLVGVVLGVPLGILLGRWLWTLFARAIYAVPEPTVSVLSIVIVAAGALLLANLVAMLPGRVAARTSTAQILRGE